MKKTLLLFLTFSFIFLSSAVAAESNLTGVWIIEGEDPLDAWTYHYRITDTGSEYFVEPYTPYKNNVNMTEKLYLTVSGKHISGRIIFDWRAVFTNGGVWTRSLRGLLDPGGNRMRLRYQAVGPAGATGEIADGWSEYEENRVFVRFE